MKKTISKKRKYSKNKRKYSKNKKKYSKKRKYSKNKKKYSKNKRKYSKNKRKYSKKRKYSRFRKSYSQRGGKPGDLWWVNKPSLYGNAVAVRTNIGDKEKAFRLDEAIIVRESEKQTAKWRGRDEVWVKYSSCSDPDTSKQVGWIKVQRENGRRNISPFNPAKPEDLSKMESPIFQKWGYRTWNWLLKEEAEGRVVGMTDAARRATGEAAAHHRGWALRQVDLDEADRDDARAERLGSAGAVLEQALIQHIKDVLDISDTRFAKNRVQELMDDGCNTPEEFDKLTPSELMDKYHFRPPDVVNLALAIGVTWSKERNRWEKDPNWKRSRNGDSEDVTLNE